MNDLSKFPASGTVGRRVGYARQSVDIELPIQIDALQAEDCDRIVREHQSNPGARSSQPMLDRLLTDLSTGDILIVTSMDRLGQSASQILALIENLHAQGIFFRSLGDSIDTSTSAGLYALEVMASVVRLEKSILAERSRSGIKAAKARGKIPGNPGLRERRPEAISAVSEARNKRYLDRLNASSRAWLPTVQQLRPKHGWDNVVEVLNRKGQDWTIERLRRAVHRLVREGLADQELLERSPRRAPEDRLMKLVAAISLADPGLSLGAIAGKLDGMGERPAGGGRKWQTSSVRTLLDEAHRYGLIRY